MKQPYTQAEINDLYQKAIGLYQTIVGLTTTPQEGSEIICMIHMLLYLNHGNGDTNVDDMLGSYCKVFKVNYKAHIEAEKGQLN